MGREAFQAKKLSYPFFKHANTTLFQETEVMWGVEAKRFQSD